MESDAFRRRFLRRVADHRGLDWAPGEESFAAAREKRLDRLGDLVAENVDREALLRLIDAGPPTGLPFVSSQLSAISGQQTTVGGAADGDASLSVNSEAPLPIPTTYAGSGHGEAAKKLKADS
jgi:hypothetical protein